MEWVRERRPRKGSSDPVVLAALGQPGRFWRIIATRGAHIPFEGSPTDDRRIFRPLSLALPAAAWFLCIFSNRAGGLTLNLVAALTALLVILALVDIFAPGREAPLWRRLTWLGAEVFLCFAISQVNGNPVRPALTYILPVSQALRMFDIRTGIALSLTTWGTYAVNVYSYLTPTNKLYEFPNYYSYILGCYVVGALLTWIVMQQSGQRRKIQSLYQDLQAAYTELKGLHQQARETAIVQERNRLAREIHDTVAHYLTVVNLQLEAAEKLGPAQADQSLAQVRRARRLTVDCLQEVRRSVAALRSSNLEDLSLPRALRKLTSEFAENTGLAITLRTDVPEDTRLAPETAMTLYRAAQEGLTNVHKHASARSAQVNLAQMNGSIVLTVEDDGAGPQEPQGAPGFGLIGLRERVALLEGAVDFCAKDDGGSRLQVVLPRVAST